MYKYVKFKGVCSREKRLFYIKNLPKGIVLIFLTFAYDEEKSTRKTTQICQTLNKKSAKILFDRKSFNLCK